MVRDPPWTEPVLTGSGILPWQGSLSNVLVRKRRGHVEFHSGHGLRENRRLLTHPESSARFDVSEAVSWPGTTDVPKIYFTIQSASQSVSRITVRANEVTIAIAFHVIDPPETLIQSIPLHDPLYRWQANSPFLSAGAVGERALLPRKFRPSSPLLRHGNGRGTCLTDQAVETRVSRWKPLRNGHHPVVRFRDIVATATNSQGGEL